MLEFSDEAISAIRSANSVLPDRSENRAVSSSPVRREGSPEALHIHSNSGDAMNWDRIEGNWTQLKGKVREQWGRLTDDELDKIAGRREKLANEKCKSLSGNAKDVCHKEAKGNEKVAKAELEAKRKGTPHAMYDVAKEKADATYEVAKEKCDDLKGADKSACKKQAKADKDKAMADAKAIKKS